MNAGLEQIKQEIISGAEAITTSKEAYEFRKKFLDGKTGKIGLLMREMKNMRQSGLIEADGRRITLLLQ